MYNKQGVRVGHEKYQSLFVDYTVQGCKDCYALMYKHYADKGRHPEDCDYWAVIDTMDRTLLSEEAIRYCLRQVEVGIQLTLF